jgi:hypothetical protein
MRDFRFQNGYFLQQRDILLWFPAGNGTVRNVGVKNESDEEILRHVMTLRSAAGRSTHVKVRERHVQLSEGGQRASASIQVHLHSI